MLFSSLTFIFFFLPILFLVYLPKNLTWRNAILLLFSILFYAWGGVSVTALLLISILLNHVFAKQVIKQKKTALVFGIIFNILLLFFFKYIDFFIENLQVILSLFDDSIHLNSLGVKLPLGISFFTFQGISMLIDIHRNPTYKDLKLQDTALYISFFPQLIAGPILRFDTIIHQIKQRIVTWDKIHYGFQRFSLGLFKKVAIANTLGLLVETIGKHQLEDINSSVAWLGIIAYSLQLYYDFSGYSDMAIGLGSVFGFNIPENFNFPYISKSIQEFWRRWHISLSSWFRDYLYIPLGGNQQGKWKTYRNLLIVFFLTGFWHGAAWSFIVWGMFHGTFILLERIGFARFLSKLPTGIQHVYTLMLVLIGWVFFSQENLSDALNYIQHLFQFNTHNTLNFTHFLNYENSLFLSIGILLAIPWNRFSNYFAPPLRKISAPVLQVIPSFLFFYSIILLSGSTFNPFIYFRF
jgi:alginate O-acetyltransferase complex protein AlgI